jgi:methylamine dehydrogenase accessory protein MauD
VSGLSTETTALGLIGLLTVLNAVGTIALIRQVGLLHLRINPLRALDVEEAVKPGDVMSFDEADFSFASLPAATERAIFAFVSPTCSLCAPLLPGLRRIHTELDEIERLVVVADTTRERLREYASSKRLTGIDTIADDMALARNQIPGAPYLVVADRAGTVLTAGAVNSLEQIELLVEDARSVTEHGVPVLSQAVLQEHENGGLAVITSPSRGETHVG